MERHDHIVQEVDGQNDFGEDLYVTFTEDSRVTGDVIKVQVKGGRSWQRSHGYSVPVGDHGETWSDGNVPVLCVVHDPETDILCWANATEQLLAARREQSKLKAVSISSEDTLGDDSVAGFVATARRYVDRYRGNQAVRSQLGEMAGVEFGTSDLVRHFVNEFGEDLVFWQRLGEGYATLLHSDLDWEPQYIGPEMLHFDTSFGMPGLGPTPTVGGTILNMPEAFWLAACFSATDWARQPIPDREVSKIRPEIQDIYLSQQIKRRLWAVPDLMDKSVMALRSDADTTPAKRAEIASYEADASVRELARKASSDTWDEMSPDARRLATLYLVKDVVVGDPSQPIGEQLRIIWRWKRPWGEYSFSARVGSPSTRLTSRRELIFARQLLPGDRIYWLSRSGRERGRRVSDAWKSEKTSGAVCLLFDQLLLGDTFWPGEEFVRAKRAH